MGNQESSKKKFYKRWWFWAIVIFIFYIIGSSSGNKDKTLTAVKPEAPVIQATTTQKVEENKQVESQAKTQSISDAQKELDDLIALSKKANLVQSYEFSDSATVVYVTDAWNTQTVQFKKDFMAKVGTFKKVITGYTHFEVRNAYSDEKVGEIESFSQELKVYK